MVVGIQNNYLLRVGDIRDAMMIGSPQQIIEKILYQHELYWTHQRYLAQLDFAGVPFENIMKNIELIGKKFYLRLKNIQRKRLNNMKVLAISSSIVGSKTRTAMNAVFEEFKKSYATVEIELMDLAEMDIQFSDGRNYLEYEGDTGRITKAMMEADAL